MTPMVTKCGLSYYSSIARVLIFCSHFLGQILERDGMDIVPPEFQRYVDAESVNFIENICKFRVFEGIHRRIVSAPE